MQKTFNVKVEEGGHNERVIRHSLKRMGLGPTDHVENWERVRPRLIPWIEVNQPDAVDAAVAGLLGLNLLVNLPTQEAEAAPPWLPPVDDSPTVVGMAIEPNNDRVWRIWSDGVFETRRRQNAPSGPGVCWSFVGTEDWLTVEDCP